jgi:hypothetical protein
MDRISRIKKERMKREGKAACLSFTIHPFLPILFESGCEVKEKESPDGFTSWRDGFAVEDDHG